MGSDGREQPTSLAHAGAATAVDRLAEGYQKLQQKDLAVVRAMNRFADLPTRFEDPERAQLMLLLQLPEEELKKQGWNSKRELRMAAYGTLPRSQWPASMQAAHERVGMRLRKQSAQAKKNVFNLQVINIPAAQPADESKVVIVDVDPKPDF